MTTVAIAADLHFGIQSKFEDTLEASRVMIQYCADNNIDTLIILGDLFHDRKSLDIKILSNTYNLISESKNRYNVNWITFPGNHDMYLRYSWEITSIDAFRDIMTVIGKITLMTIDDIRFWVVPFIQSEVGYLRTMDRIVESMEPEDNLLTHMGVKNAYYDSCFLFKTTNLVSLNQFPFRRIYTGHFHVKQQVKRTYYPGSLIPLKFDEGDHPHGFYIYDIHENDHEFINIWNIYKQYSNKTPPPQYRTIDINKINETDVNNCNVRIVFTEYISDARKRELKQQLTDRGARIVRWLDKTEKSEFKQNTQERVFSTFELFNKWIELDKKSNKYDRELLLSLNKQVVNEGDEKYMSEYHGEY